MTVKKSTQKLEHQHTARDWAGLSATHNGGQGA